jgi:hypothetical protein
MGRVTLRRGSTAVEGASLVDIVRANHAVSGASEDYQQSRLLRLESE